jgi:LysM repeat protein
MDLQISKYSRIAIYSFLLVSLLALIRSSSVLAQTSTDTPEPFSGIQTVTPAADGSVIHTVQDGESLNLIATAYGITVDEIKQLNNLSSDLIQPGDKLLIRTVSTATPTLEATQTPTQPLPTSTRRPTRTPTLQPPAYPRSHTSQQQSQLALCS